ncbi:MAG: class I SAM-dependent methyltransferase [Candidatus Micrarchaeota archaeon]|nr:class I SAM-dependent methyltransferase [Candidatus Micrarchaeota archaeon]
METKEDFTEGAKALISLKRKIAKDGAHSVAHFKFYPEGLVVPPNVSAKNLQLIHNINVPEKVDKVLRRLEKLNSTWAIKQEKLTAEERKVWMPNNEMRLWQIPRRTGLFLYHMAKQTKAREILELGTSAGYSGIWQAMGVKENDGIVHTADMSMLKIGMASKNIEAAGIDNIVQLRGTISEVLDSWHRPIDMVFLDADKQNYAEYLRRVLPKLKVGGYVIADNAIDFIEHMSSLIEVLRDGGKHESKLYSYILHLDNGIYMIRKGEPIDNGLVTSFFNASTNSF